MMVIVIKMGRHKEWRKLAKRERRRKIRTQIAKERESGENDETRQWLQEQHDLELQLELELIEKTNKEENLKWLQAEKIALEKWQKLQDLKEKKRLENIERETKIRLEWEQEQERKKKEEERLKELEEEKRKRQESFMKHLEEFLLGDTSRPPAELLVNHETKPNQELCPFFSKTACCRFGDQCSRNHQYPNISKVLMAPNFFMHFGLNNSNNNEYDTDLMLEYEDSDTYKEFKDFFYDILPEFEKYGKITMLRVCNNYEKHLRGNTYVEYAELRCAVAAYRALHTRWYGGRQISLQFCIIPTWKSAICGLQARRRCPKGRSCNFLHVFRNPNNMFSLASYEWSSERKRSPSRDHNRSWRWSESPELELSRSRQKSRRRSRSRSPNRGTSNSRREERRRKRSSERKSRRETSESNESRKKSKRE